MAIYVHITDECRADAKTLNLERELSKAQKAILDSQNLSTFSFLSPAVLKKKIGRHFRLIAWQHELLNDHLIVFLRLLQRHPKDYPAMLAKIKADPEPYGHDELHKIHADLTVEPPPSRKTPPNDEERAWLDAVYENRSSITDPFVFETHDWVTGMRQNKIAALYHQLLFEMTDLDGLKDASSDPVSVRWATDMDTGIAYHYRPDLDCLLLLAPLRGASTEAQIERSLNLVSDINDRMSLLRQAARSYPLLMVLDRDAWLAIQEDEEANMALSPEEAQIIASSRTTKSDSDFAFPLFINGLAGSGKSTILQYFASAYLDFSLRRKTNHLPLYLTASEDLLARARETVERLLTTNHERVLEDKIDPDAIAKLLSNSFRTYHELLHSILPTKVQHDLRKDRYLNYASFRRLWEPKFSRLPKTRQISVEVSWHVIRSLIKGIRSRFGEELSPEDFEDLPRRRRSVSSETFARVYEEIWSAWYKPLCEKDGYWDDQDLAAHVLDTGVASDEHRAAIFCDEAQDFTSADLDVIFQLSLYSKRALLTHELRRVPIIFAGDPLQTINPTGFRWDAIKADFHERFRATIDARIKSSIEMNYRDLSFNYRSNEGIVRFCNLLQLARAVLLDRSDIRPQEYWWRDDPVSPICFAIEDPATESHLRDRPELIKLVDCHEGEETDYVERDPILKRIVEQEERTYRNVMCPTRAKGLEFSGVVLYRFGEDKEDKADFEDLLAGRVDLDDPQSRLPWEYFFNRLYVAASRARDRLIIVDSVDAIKHFWKVATDPEVHEQLLGTVRERHIWEKKYAPLLDGTPEEWTEGRIDQREQAQRFAAQGKRDHDPYLLRQAGLSYRSVNDDFSARRCFAQATEIEGNWKTAGDRYANIRLYEDAFRCYWLGRLWQPLKQLAVQTNDVYRMESRAADFMASGQVPPSSFLERLVSGTEDPKRLREIGDDPTWRTVLAIAADRVSNAGEDFSILWPDLFRTFNLLADAGVPIRKDSLAALAYRGGDFEKAVELWQVENNVRSRKYKRAKANVAAFPECLEFLNQLKDYAEILRRWYDERPSDAVIRKLDPRIAHVVTDAALDQGEITLAATIVDAHPDSDHVGKLLKAAAKTHENDIVCNGAITATRLFVQTKQWKEAVDAESLVSIGKLAGIPHSEIRASLDRLGKSSVVLETLVWEFATSEDLVEEAPTAVASFLHQHFLGRSVVPRSEAPDHNIPTEVIGAAIERSGRIVDALQYYEDLLENEESTRDTKRFAAARLICNLERHARYFERRRNQSQAQQQQTRADQLRRVWRIEDRDLRDYPEVRKSAVKTSPTMPRTESQQSFWDSPTLDELARLQNVEPVSDVEDLFGTWPGDSNDRFEADIDALRHRHSGDSNS